MKFHHFLITTMAGIACALASCDSDTATIGIGIMPDQDELATFNETFSIKTRSVLTGPVVANTSSCYFGSIIDPETRAITTSSFLAQYHLQEDYTLPEYDKIIKDETGDLSVDSCVIRIFHDKFYGDSLATMKLTVTDLSLDNVMEEDQTFYTNINPDDYVNKTPKVKRTVTYSVLDQNLPSSSTSLSSGNYRSIPIHLGKEYGYYILKNFYDHPEFFKNSYTFIHNICPGFYIEHAGGVGSMINADVSALDVYFRYQENDTTITKAWMRLAATQEVIQNTHFDHEIPAEMLDDNNPYTYIKSPAGIHTEISLPIDEIASGKHYKDTLNSARFTLRRFVPAEQNKFALPAPANLLLVRKGQAEKFFADKELPNSVTSFLCSYSSSSNAYTFTNIAPLISYIRKERDNAAGISKTDDEATRKMKWDALAAKDPYWSKEGDWNKFDLIPVRADYTTTSSYYGTQQVLVGIYNDYNLTSVKLEGNSTDVQLNVIYSRFEK